VLQLQFQRLSWTGQFRLQPLFGSGVQTNCVQSEMLQVAAGHFTQGHEGIQALDNEKPLQQVYLETYWIDRYPVTCRQYQAFMEAGGYSNSRWWSQAGWTWLQSNPVSQPLYWDPAQAGDHPVCGVSWYEADAYARFVGKRLPLEAEWEKAASWQPATAKQQTYPWGETEPTAKQCNHSHNRGQTTPVNHYPAGQSSYGCYDMLGNVWEWTATPFHPYPGFISYPYAGYSTPYFDNQHYVLKGGSWATRAAVLRCAFRNWYHPGVRQLLAGFRCAHS
ncbi:MAG TPA: SUMF1/EgtB/PvdO family nonheme iron enzyme, partial [Candidatus Caenarcaniphilales bacterium]